MSWMPGAEARVDTDCPKAVDMVIIPRTSDIGNFEVRRALPFRDRRMVGPFIFWDEMGPGEFLTGQGLDVRPHPHIGLSTVTYLFRGEMDHRDSLGTHKTIVPGDVNLMSAGKGIVHSERTGAQTRTHPHILAGIQSWVAQPKSHEDSDPAFVHHGQAELPVFESDGLNIRMILGQGFGLKSPVKTDWDSFYADIRLKAGSTLPVPKDIEERALYVLAGRVEIGGTLYDPHRMLVLHPGSEPAIKALDDVHLMLLGGAAMDGPRYIWWNFVASSKERIEYAARQWKDRAFPNVPGDEAEFIPLQDLPDQAHLKP